MTLFRVLLTFGLAFALSSAFAMAAAGEVLVPTILGGIVIGVSQALGYVHGFEVGSGGSSGSGKAPPRGPQLKFT